MRFSKIVVTIAALCAQLDAQKPVGFTGFIGNYLDYYLLGASPQVDGDTYYFSAMASNAMKPLFPNPSGAPVVGALNDGGVGSCSGNIELVQLSKLYDPFVTPTTSNTVITAFPNCMSSYGTAPGATNVPAGWLGHLGASSDGHNDGTWKSPPFAFRNNVLLAPIFRQTSAGNAFGDATMVLSPDAGRTWIDWSRYNTSTVTGASCNASVVTLTAANSNLVGDQIYVHDVVPSGYNGKATLTGATGTTVTFTLKDVFGTTLSCPGAYVSGGGFGKLDPNGSAPLYDGASATMMWPLADGWQMQQQNIIIYGQDGSYPAGIEPACDPTVYVCGISYAKGSNSPYPTYLYRVPVGQEMNKAAYQWYACSAYNPYWPVAETVCDGNLASSWTSTMTNATNMVYTKRFGSGARPGECFSVRYLPSHSSYIMTCLQESYIYAGGRSAAYWAPHPWGPYYPLYNSSATGYGPNLAAFLTALPYAENIISTTPPRTQIMVAADQGPGTHSPGGNPSFGAMELGGGRVPPAGMARIGDWLGDFGYTGMGHRLVSGNMAGAISRRGSGIGGPYSLAWWFDLWDHGGDTHATNRPYYRDIVSGGTKAVNAMFSQDGSTWKGPAFAYATAPTADGVHVDGGNGYGPHLISNFTDSTFSGNPGWSVVMVVKPDTTGNALTHMFHVTHANTVYNGWDLKINFGTVSAGDVCVRWNTDAAMMCTAGGVITANQWYFVAVTAAPNASGYPTITIHVGDSTAGTFTEYGGISMATAASGTTINGLTKTCTACSTTPNIAGGASLWLGSVPTSYGGFTGTYGEVGAYSGAVPGHVIREIYRTLRSDWARVARGSI